jgi:hypothetical protein
MAMNFAPLDCSCQGASSEPKKIYMDFAVIEKFAKNQKIPCFWLSQQKMGSMSGTFTITEFNSSYTITDSNLVRIGDKKFLEKNHVPPPFYLIFTSENHLNAHSSFIKQHMAMNFAPLDCSCQGASSEPKKIYMNFSVLEKFAKKPKNPYFWLSQQKMGSMGGTFTIPEFNSSYTITDSNLVRIGDKKFLEKNHVPPPSI